MKRLLARGLRSKWHRLAILWLASSIALTGELYAQPTSLSFGQLQAFRFLYISPTHTQFARATERFRSVVKQPLESDMSSKVLWYFVVRQRFENRQYVVPVTEDFEFLDEAKCRFHGDRFDCLYKAWISGTLSETS